MSSLCSYSCLISSIVNFKEGFFDSQWPKKTDGTSWDFVGIWSTLRESVFHVSKSIPHKIIDRMWVRGRECFPELSSF